MANYISLTNPSINSGTEVKLFGAKFRYIWKNDTLSESSSGSYAVQESQFNGWENPRIQLDFYITSSTPSNYMTWALWNQFVKAQYTGSSSTQNTLKVAYGSSDTLFADYSADSTTSSVTSIPVQIDNYDLRFSPDDSDKASFWTIVVSCTRTK